MKNRKRIITTLIGMALTSQLSPVAYTIVNAQEPAAVQAQCPQDQQKTGLATNVITFGGNGCWETKNPDGTAGMHKVEISFDTTNMKLSTKVLSGYYGTAHSFHEWCPGEYIKVELISGETGQIKKQAEMSGKDNIKKLTDALDKLPFEYGDYLRIYHGEGMQRTTITGPVLDENGDVIKNDYDTKGISTADLNKYEFEITQKGLVRENQNIIPIDNANDLICELIALNKSKYQETIKLTKSIEFDDAAINKLACLNNNKKELTIPEGTTLIGSDKNVTIDLKGQASLVLKGNYTGLQNITIKNSDKDGVQVYDSSYSSLKNVSVTGSKGYGIYVNGSTVAMQDCTTKDNSKGGILISSSIDLELRKNKISTVTFKTNTNKFNEKDKEVVIKNLKLIKKCDSSEIKGMQNNTFKVEYGKMGNDKGPDAYTSTKKDNETGLNPTYQNIFSKKYPGIKFDDVKVKEEYKYYKLVL